MVRLGTCLESGIVVDICYRHRSDWRQALECPWSLDETGQRPPDMSLSTADWFFVPILSDWKHPQGQFQEVFVIGAGQNLCQPGCMIDTMSKTGERIMAVVIYLY